MSDESMTIERATEVRARAHGALIVEAKKRLHSVQEQVGNLIQQQQAIASEIAMMEEAQTVLSEGVERNEKKE